MQYVPNAQLIIVGTGELEVSLRKLVEELDLTEQVILTGKLDYKILHALLKSCDIFCLSSIERTEAFGLVLLEAMAYEKPIVISKVPGSGMNWVTQDQVTALFAKKENPDDFAQQLNTLITSLKLRENLGQNGKQRLLDFFQISTISSKTLNLYHNLTNIKR